MSEQFGTLWEVGVEVTNRCNLSCLHCMRDREADRADLPLDLYEHILDQARAYGIRHVALTGGEPTVHPEIGRLLELTASKGFSYHIVTNAYDIGRLRPLLLEHHKRGALSGVSISLDGASEETNDAIRGEGVFRRVMETIAFLHASGVPFSLQMVVNRLNLPEIEQYGLMAAELGARKVYFAYPQPTPELVRRGLMPSPEEAEAVKARVLKLAGALNIEVYLSVGYKVEQPFFSCRALQMTALSVDYKGRLVFCCQLSGYVGSPPDGPDVVADLREVPLAEAHKRLVEKIGRFQLDLIERIERGEVHEGDMFPCIYCARYFGKLSWLDENFPESPWARPEGR